jgi:hypothetical protein
MAANGDECSMVTTKKPNAEWIRRAVSESQLRDRRQRLCINACRDKSLSATPSFPVFLDPSPGGRQEATAG